MVEGDIFPVYQASIFVLLPPQPILHSIMSNHNWIETFINILENKISKKHFRMIQMLRNFILITELDTDPIERRSSFERPWASESGRVHSDPGSAAYWLSDMNPRFSHL